MRVVDAVAAKYLLNSFAGVQIIQLLMLSSWFDSFNTESMIDT